MGLDDRDYMHERYRMRASQTRWNDGRGRIEAAWLDPKHPIRPRRSSPDRQNGRRAIVWGLSGLLMLIPLYSEFQRKGWIPDFEASDPFPETGSVTVARTIKRRHITSSLTVVTSGANAVVQLYDPASNAHVLSVYVVANDQITIPAPAGVYRMRLVEGKKWHGTTRYFGPNTSYATVPQLMTFEPSAGQIIDLDRRPDGNLRTRMMIARPDPL